MSAIPLSQPVQAYVSAFASRRRKLSLLKAVGFALALTFMWMLIACLVDRFAHLGTGVRVVVLLTNLAAVGVILYRPVLQAWQARFDAMESATQLEKYDTRFAERLQTVTSQAAAPAHLRGSPDFLAALGREVDQLAVGQRADVLLPTRLINPPWIAAIVATAIILLLMPFSYLSMPTLIARYFAPLADIMPVTTTRLTVEPGTVDLVEGQSLAVRVQSVRLGDALVTLHTTLSTSQAGETWSTVAMTPGETQSHTFNVANVDRDMKYFVTGGDATSRVFDVRVRRAPAVSEFRIRYTYPAYTSRDPLTVSNVDGLIEAPVGSEAMINIVATEPLTEATVEIDGKTMLSQPTLEPTVRQVKLSVDRDCEYRVHLTSDRNVPGGGPGTMFIRAVPDRAPLIRLLQPSDDLRLSPRDILPIQYQAMDDYGIDSLHAHVQINSAPARAVGIKLRGDSRRQEAGFNLDFAAFDLKVGDVVTLNVSATDKTGQSAVSESRSILISPRSIDLNTHLRLAELRNALQLAQGLADELQAAMQSLDQARATGMQVERAYMMHFNALSQHLAGASDQATLLRLALGRAVMRSDSPDLSTTLANFVDSAQIGVGVAEDVSQVVGQRTPQMDAPRARLAQAQQLAVQLQQSLKIVAEGEHARALLADRANLRETEVALAAVTDTPTADRLRQTLQRAKEDVAAGARLLSLNPDDGNLDAQLNGRAEQSKNFTKQQKTLDLAAAVPVWLTQLQTPLPGHLSFDQRFAAAAQVEAIRPDPELRRAADLQLAARAAARLQTVVTSDEHATTQPIITEPAQQFAAAITALQVDHEIARHPENIIPPDQLQQIRSASADARVKLARWAGDKPVDVAGNPAGTSDESNRSQEELAVEASAAAADKDYEKAKALDEKSRKKQEEAAAKLASPEQMKPDPSDASAAAKVAAGEKQPTTPEEQAALEKAKLDAAKKIELAMSEKPADATPADSEKSPDAQKASADGQKPASGDKADGAKPAESQAALARAAEAKRLADERAKLRDKTDQATERAKELDRIQSEQQKLLAETEKAKADKQAPAPETASKQDDLAKAIGKVEKDIDDDLWDDLMDEDDADSREDAANAIMAAQEQLAGMPEQMAKATEAAKQAREADQRSQQATNAAKQAENVIKEKENPVAQQTAQKKQADEQVSKAMDQLNDASAKQSAANDAAAKADAKAQATQEAAKRAEAERAAAQEKVNASQPDQKAAADQANVAAQQAKAHADQANTQATQEKAQADQTAAQAKQQTDAADQRAKAAEAQAKAIRDQLEQSQKVLDQATASGDVAKRTADEATKQLDDSKKRLDEMKKPVLPVAAEMLAGALSKFSPETKGATTAIDQKLLPVLKQLEQALTVNNNPGQIDQLTAQARQAVDVVQDELRKGQDELVERDPLVAAKAFAQAAAQALRKEPPDMDAATRYQQSTSSALQRAWEGQIQQAAQARLAQLPNFGSLFAIPIAVDGQARGTGAGVTSAGPPEAPTLREWGRLRAREGDNLNASMRESDAPEYQESLKAYFEALGKSNVTPAK